MERESVSLKRPSSFCADDVLVSYCLVTEGSCWASTSDFLRGSGMVAEMLAAAVGTEECELYTQWVGQIRGWDASGQGCFHEYSDCNTVYICITNYIHGLSGCDVKMRQILLRVVMIRKRAAEGQSTAQRVGCTLPDYICTIGLMSR